MDLNHLYSQHQVSLMSAAATTSRLARTRHMAAAGVFGDRIRNYQLSIGAPAASGWLHRMETSERCADPAAGLSS